MKRHGRAEAIVTDRLRSYPAAMRELGNEYRREMGGHANNRTENSHLPFRRRERAMQRFRWMKSLQSSFRFTLRSIIISTWNVISSTVRLTSFAARPP
ncbi:MAG: DDE-type integrase/transposase/recombinase [Novosphingobium sp.]